MQDLGGKFKKPALRKVRVSADEMLKALFGSKSKGSMDLRANLKSVKKEELKQEKVQLGQADVQVSEIFFKNCDNLMVFTFMCVLGDDSGGG